VVKTNEVAIIGSGIMGHGIAQVAAMSGQTVALVDISEDLLNRAREAIHTSLNKLAEKGRIKEKPDEVLGRIEFVTDLEGAAKNAKLVIEAVSENIDLKIKIFRDAEKVAPPDAIFASNTSSLSIDTMAKATNRPDKFIGMHWMNPPVLMRLIEIIKGSKTSNETLQFLVDLCQRYNKEIVIAKKDVWYFLSARTQVGWPIETALMVLNGEATVEEIDAMARYKLNLPMGPFELTDLTGAADIRVNAIESLKKILAKNPNFEPWPKLLEVFEYATNTLLKPMKEKGLTGVKTGKGFYTYPAPGKYEKPVLARELADKVSPIKPLATAANTAAWCVTNGVGSVEDVERCFKLAYGWPKGIFEFVEEFGARAMVDELKEKQERAPDWMKAFYTPDPLLVQMCQ